jgi:hypothetical protein
LGSSTVNVLHLFAPESIAKSHGAVLPELPQFVAPIAFNPSNSLFIHFPSFSSGAWLRPRCAGRLLDLLFASSLLADVGETLLEMLGVFILGDCLADV